MLSTLSISHARRLVLGLISSYNVQKVWTHLQAKRSMLLLSTMQIKHSCTSLDTSSNQKAELCWFPWNLSGLCDCSDHRIAVLASKPDLKH